jgi:hypothetical protein
VRESRECRSFAATLGGGRTTTAMPRGGLRKDLIACLRHGRARRRPRSRGQDRRGQIPDMLSLHVRPPEVEDRLVPGHWESDLIKGARNQSAVVHRLRLNAVGTWEWGHGDRASQAVFPPPIKL